MGETPKHNRVRGFAHDLLYPCLLISANYSKDLSRGVAWDGYAIGRLYFDRPDAHIILCVSICQLYPDRCALMA
ncbi:MAG TPA: hypothetical protein DCR43_00665 [Bacteroidales bacterium]|nr:MAG: hypothetical protein A2X11_01540 [Bacteroidetes bacterium GWE2_42_24]OFY31773.1 MAG: hypothetical protein A2X09_16735 [Bacteroidetes bacterium GWF2_43_11]HAQ64364.1 hypothetical protein [Bacteroidales bacterium]